QEASPAIVEPLPIENPFLEDQFHEDPPKDPPEVPMADDRTMVELLRAPTEGYEDAIVIPEIAANNFELKHAISSNIAELKDMVRALLLDKKNQSSAPASSSNPAPVRAIEPNCVTCGGSWTLSSNTVTNPKEDLKGITTRSDVAYQGPTIPTPSKQGTEGELTLRIENEAITYNLDQTSRYFANYNQMTANKIDAICEDYSQEVLSFSDTTKELKVYEAKTVKFSVDEPPEVEPKDLPPYLEYGFLVGDNKLPIIIAKELGDEEKSALIKILMEEDYKPVVQHQRRVNPKIYDVIKKEVEKLLDAGLVYPISDSPWMFEGLAGNEYYCFLDGFSGYFQIPIDPRYQEKTTFTCLYGTFSYRRMPFGLCNAPGTFQRCMLAIFHDMVEKTMEVFMDDFSIFGNSFENCLSRLDKMLQRCEDTNLSLNMEKNHFMVKEGIVQGHKISKNRIEVDKAKVNVIAKLPYPTIVKGIRSFLGHAGFYRRFIQDFSKISRPMTHLLEKNTLFIFS
nr:reverse transcriptase domain-containing protein [Tanacetum cinerariifolium]